MNWTQNQSLQGHDGIGVSITGVGSEDNVINITQGSITPQVLSSIVLVDMQDTMIDVEMP